MKLKKIKRKYSEFAGKPKLIIAFLAIITFGLIVPGTEKLGFWESTHSLKKKTSANIRREKNRTIPTELTRLIQLEQKSSTKWPHLPQWIYRGSSRLPLSPEFSTRIPSILFSFLLLFTLLFFSSVFFSRKIMFWNAIVLITTPLFLMGSRTINLELPWFVFSSLFILTSFYIFEKLKLSTNTLAFAIIIAFGSLILSHLARGLFLGVIFPLFTVLLGELFLIQKNSTRNKYLFLTYLGIFILIMAGFTIDRITMGDSYSHWLYTLPNPVSLIPLAEKPHALFTAHFRKAVFAFYPWTPFLLPAFILFLSELKKLSLQNIEIRMILRVAIWLLCSWGFVSYWKVRMGDVLTPALLPFSIFTGFFLVNFFHKVGKLSLRLFLSLSGLLLFRDIIQYPEILGESTIHYQLDKIQPQTRIWLTLALIPSQLPLFLLIWKKKGKIIPGLVAIWEDMKTTSYLFKLIYLLLFPFRFILFYLGKYVLVHIYRFCKRIYIWVSKFILMVIAKLGKLLPRELKNRRTILALSTGVFAIWFSWQWLPFLSFNLSTRPVYAAFQKQTENDELVAVYNLNSASAPVYINKEAVNLKSYQEIYSYFTSDQKRFLILPSNMLGTFDFNLRRRKIPYFVPSKPTPRYLLVSNQISNSNKDYNPLLPFINTKTPPQTSHKATTQFEQGLSLEGYHIPSESRRGQEITITLVFKVQGKLNRNYKIFIHLDPPYGTRITGDHDPVQGLLSTKNWSKGTWITDTHTIKIPYFGFPSGRYRIYAGLFKGKSRLEIIKGGNDGHDRAPLGTMIVRDPYFPGCSGN